ncbi:hypothetical protein SAMN05216404_11290 [Nitrosospira multiformis]|uniref:Uncharacterized protein n=1 Tax=Nitrosospira multiformis TaxID=1231 RepID=A0A1H8MD98_9PROT|nr:hypothetical protein SAMN05216404_11290 [Nitrosospira multiformis]
MLIDTADSSTSDFVFRIFGFAGSAKNDGFYVRLLTDPLDRLSGGNCTRCEHRHWDGAEFLLTQYSLVSLETAAHAKPDLVDVGTHDRILDTTSSSASSNLGMFTVMKPRSASL